MLYFLDTEFIEAGPQYPLSLVSIGIVDEEGREYYAENREAALHLANDWVRANVFPHLTWTQAKPTRKICEELYSFIHGPHPIFWGYYCQYDWVLFCQLFGTMADLPTALPRYCHDLRQRLDALGLANITQPDDMPHHALSDARWIRNAYLKE